MLQTDGSKTLGFEERWNKTNRMLLAEADEWGQYGIFRSPMGEYLEELSKRPIPESARNLRDGDGAGIIDVVYSENICLLERH
jgi:hypothetical protein